MLPWAAPLVLYLLVVAPLAWHQRQKINYDASAYLANAQHVARGEWRESVSGYWSPMISWSIAPLLWMKVDPLYAARLAMCIWGAAFVVVTGRWAARFVKLDGWWAAGVGCVIALATAPVAVRQITPDLMMATWLMAWFSAVTHEEFLKSPRRQLVAGLLGGAAFLAKAYALPVVLVHLVFTVFLQRFGARSTWRRTAGALGLGLAGVAIVAGPWIAVLSARYGKFTFSTSGVHAHAYVGPRAAEARIPGGRVPGGIDGESLAGGAWSPLESREFFDHQMRIVQRNASAMLRFVGLFDGPRSSAGRQPAALVRIGGVPVNVSMLALVVSVLAALGVWKLACPRWHVAWLVGTMMIYISGLMCVWFEVRYVASVVLPLCLVLALKLVMQSRFGETGKRVMAGAVVVSFSVGALAEAAALWRMHSPTIYRQVATRLRAAGLTGDIASNHRQAAAFVAAIGGREAVRLPDATDSAELEAQLRSSQVEMLLVWENAKPTTRPAATRPAAKRGLAKGGRGKASEGAPAAGEEESPMVKIDPAVDLARVRAVVGRPGWREAMAIRVKDVGKPVGEVKVFLPPWSKQTATTQPAKAGRGKGGRST